MRKQQINTNEVAEIHTNKQTQKVAGSIIKRKTSKVAENSEAIDKKANRQTNRQAKIDRQAD